MRITKIKTQLSQHIKKELVTFLMVNRDILAWSHSNIYGISPDIACHTLNVNPKAMPVKQKKARNEPTEVTALKEVKKLLANEFIREAKHPKWIANPVIVKKSKGK